MEYGRIRRGFGAAASDRGGGRRDGGAGAGRAGGRAHRPPTRCFASTRRRPESRTAVPVSGISAGAGPARHRRPARDRRADWQRRRRWLREQLGGHHLPDRPGHRRRDAGRGDGRGRCPGAGDVPTGYDFNPAAPTATVIDRMRFVNSTTRTRGSTRTTGRSPAMTPTSLRPPPRPSSAPPMTATHRGLVDDALA